MAKAYFCFLTTRREAQRKTSNNNLSCLIIKVGTTMGKTKFCRYADWRQLYL